jgi:Abnormal spindle-like microcephaly-assoc'd, ASPM-SPD-2-Hydin
VAFSPTAIGARTATLSLTDSPDPNSPYAISLSGTGLIPVSVSTTSVTMASSAVGNTSATKNITVTNNQNGPISFSPVLGGANPADFVIAASSTCTATLAANSKCVYSVAFSPTAIGARTATLSLTDSPDPNSPYAISLSGAGLIPVSVSAAGVSFATTTVGGTSAAKILTVTNNQSAAVGLSPTITGANAGDFAITAAGTCAGTLAASSKCTYSLAFTPTAKGSRTANMTLSDSPDPSSPYTISLTGTGK